MTSPARPEAARPYAPSWIDRLTDAIERLPGARWLPYAVVGAALLLVELALLAAEGRALAAIHPFVPYFAVAGVYAVAFSQFLRAAAGRAFDQMRASLADVGADEGDRLRYELTTLPPLPTLAFSIAAPAAAMALALPSGSILDQGRAFGLPVEGAGAPFNLALYVLNWAATGAFAYRILHQSRMVARIQRRARVDLLRQASLHALASLTARTTLGLAILIYLPILMYPADGELAIWVVVWALQAALLASAFLWPLLGLHDLLAAERTRLLGRNLQRWREALEEAHARLAAGERAGTRADVDLAGPAAAMDLLEREQRALRAASTWPWPTGVGRGVLVAIVLPLILALLQTVLIRSVVG